MTETLSLGERKNNLRPMLPHVVAISAIYLIQFFLAIKLGKDISFDLRNYHFYGGYELLNGLSGRDFLPAGGRSSLSGSLDILVYLGIAHLPPLAFGMIVIGVHALNGVLLYAIALTFLPGKAGNLTVLAIASFVILSLSNNSFLAVLGLTTHDQIICLLFLAPCYLALSQIDSLRAGPGKSWPLILAIGFLAGLGVGFKLTAIPNFVGLLIGIVIVQRSVTIAITVGAIGGAAGLVGYGIAAFPGLHANFINFGNPFFPAFGWLFPSPYVDHVAALTSLYGDRQTIFEIVLAPFQQFRGTPPATPSLMLYVVGIASFLFIARALIARRASRGPLPFDGRSLFFLTAFSTSSIAWALMYLYARFALAQLVLLPLATFLLLKITIFALSKTATRDNPISTEPSPLSSHDVVISKPLLATIVVTFSVMIALAFVSAPFTGTARAGDIQRSDWSGEYFNVAMPSSFEDRHSLILLLGNEPVSYLIPYFSEQTRFVRIQPLDFEKLGTVTASQREEIFRIVTTYADEPNILVALPLGDTDMQFIDDALKRYLLRIVAPDCKAVANDGGNRIILCPTMRTSGP